MYQTWGRVFLISKHQEVGKKKEVQLRVSFFSLLIPNINMYIFPVILYIFIMRPLREYVYPSMLVIFGDHSL